MNVEKLKEREAWFLGTYPGGFEHPEIRKIAEKHNMDKLFDYAQKCFARECFVNPVLIVEDMIRVVTRSSMVSLFEKPKFRDYARELSREDKQTLSDGLKEFLYGDEKTGFEKMLDILKKGKMAKWTLITSWPSSVRPEYDIFIKPSTTKEVIGYFSVAGLKYNPTPDYEFYKVWRELIAAMKKAVSPSLAPYNAAFTGFLMMAMEKL